MTLAQEINNVLTYMQDVPPETLSLSGIMEQALRGKSAPLASLKVGDPVLHSP